jgi:tRNA-specific 2-thiouridylase
VNGGWFVDKTGKQLGRHKGYPFYTIGQRKGLDIALGHPVYVTAIDPDTNVVVLGDEEDLNKTTMLVNKINWLKYDGVAPGTEAITKITKVQAFKLNSLKW